MNVFFAWLIGVAIIALVMLWLILFPEQREALRAALARRLQAWGVHGARQLTHSRRALDAGRRRAGNHASDVTSRLTAHWKLLLALAVLLIVPAGLILGLRQHVALQGYGMSQPINEDTARLVTSLLQGERLAPPPALPPAVFVTKEVKRQLPHRDLGQANRNWNQLDPQFRQRLLAVFKVMRGRYGYDMVMIEGYRSPQRQAMLAAKGGDVTNAGAFQSYHQYGLAADCAFYRDGKLIISARSKWAQRGYALYGKVAKAAGLVWGGSWKSIRDLGHVELHLPGKGPRYHG